MRNKHLANTRAMDFSGTKKGTSGHGRALAIGASGVDQTPNRHHDPRNRKTLSFLNPFKGWSGKNLRQDVKRSALDKHIIPSPPPKPPGKTDLSHNEDLV